MLFVPAGDPRKLQKIPDLEADALILDLEDAVAHTRKAEARIAATHAITEHGQGNRIFVRINAFNTPYLFDDLDQVIVPGLAGILLPKAEAAREVEKVDWLINNLEKKRGIPPQSVALYAILETPRGILKALEIGGASPRLQRLCFGAGDFSLAVNLRWPPAGIQSPTLTIAKASLVIASSALGLDPPHDSVYPDFHDLDRLAQEAQEARDLGFGGKHAIHPGQIEVIRRVFTSTADEITWAQRVIEAFTKSEQSGVANVAVDGRLVDYPVYERARRVLEQVLSASEQGEHD